MANSGDPDQTAPIGAVCSWFTLFASILNASVMLGNYLQQTTSADDIQMHFSFSTSICMPNYYHIEERTGSTEAAWPTSR